MNPPVPWSSLVGVVQRTYGYFRTGIAVEGEAHLCEGAHLLIYTGGPWPPAPQHVDVSVRFWNRRGRRVSVLEVADARILSREGRLAVRRA